MCGDTKQSKTGLFLKKHSARDPLPAGNEICLEMFFVRQIGSLFVYKRVGQLTCPWYIEVPDFFAARHADIEG